MSVVLIAFAAVGPVSAHAAFDVPPSIRADLGVQSALADFNGDGRLDAATAQGWTTHIDFDTFPPQLVVTAPGSLAIELGEGDGSLLTPSDGSPEGGAVYPTPEGLNPRAVAVGDFDGDNSVDVVVAPQDDCAVNVFLNHGDGIFAPAVRYEITGIGASGVVVGDLNGDGHLDIAVSELGRNQARGPCGSGQTGFSYMTVLLNQGDGTFALAPEPNVAGEFARGIGMGDVNRDGALDLVTADFAEDGVSVFVNNGDGTFATRASYPAGDGPESVSVTDLDGDGFSDLAVANENSGDVSVLRNRGDGSFDAPVAYVTGAISLGVTAADLDGDGFPELIVAAHDAHQVVVLHNRGDGLFDPGTSYQAGGPVSVVTGDLNGDGNLDVVTTQLERPDGGTSFVTSFLGRGDGTLIEPPRYEAGNGPTGVVGSDLDGDGATDLAVTNRLGNDVSVLRNHGDGTFATPIHYQTGPSPGSIVAFDVNGDDSPDLIVGNRADGTISVLMNSGDGSFDAQTQYVAGGPHPIGVAAGDLNDDGSPDIAVASLDAANFLVADANVLFNRGDGTFDPPVDTGQTSGAVGIADFDGDGRNELLLATGFFADTTTQFRYAAGAFTATTSTRCGPLELGFTIGDLNGDHRPDLVIAGPASLVGQTPNNLCMNRGDGSLEPAGVVLVHLSAGIGDFNGDGFADIAVNGGAPGFGEGSIAGNPAIGAQLTILFNNGDTSFYRVNEGDNYGDPGLAVADLNNDGRLDLATAGARVLLSRAAPLKIATKRLGVAFLGLPYRPIQTDTPGQPGVADTDGFQRLHAVDGQAPYTWEVVSGALPPGLTMDPAGKISGLPTSEGTFEFTARVTDSNAAAPETQTKRFAITVARAPTIATSSVPDGQEGEPYSATLEGADGVPPYFGWEVVAGTLPDGLSLDSNTGVISGIPSAQTTTTFTVQVKDSRLPSQMIATREFTLTIGKAPFKVVTTVLPDADLGHAYSETLVASGGTPPYSWKNSGALPMGLTLNAKTGVISGVPRKKLGTFTFTVQVSYTTKVKKHTTVVLSASRVLSITVI